VDKGVLDLAAAFARLPSRSSLRLRFVGPMSDGTRPVVDRLREIIGPDPRVTIEPAVPAAAVPDLLASLDLLCCPSSGFENGPTIALEAMAAGTPVVGTTVGGLPEIVRHEVDGALVAPGDVAALAALLRRISDQPAIVERWKSQTGSVRTLDRVADDYDVLYETICGSASTVAC
jgi:2-deoxystreptamine N-acetyl-D-glucosaminyltransferase/2-deoxystreptamine glucosyltransferase